MPPIAHIVYIPAVLLLGIVIGFVLGTRAAKDQEAQRAKRESERAERRAARGKGGAASDGAASSSKK